MFISNQILRILALSTPLFLFACGGDDGKDGRDGANGNSNDARVAALEAQVSELEARIGEGETANTELAAMLADIRTQMDAAQGDIDKISELEAQIAILLNGVEVKYELTFTNITNNQPLSPVLAILEDEEVTYWEIGEPANPLLEQLAESGSPAGYLDLPFGVARGSADGLLAPGESKTLTLTADMEGADYLLADMNLTIASMPVNTNDAFSGVTGWNIASLAIGESTSAVLPVYDAGTEANTETAATVPGPAAGGEGYNVVRDDIADQVTRHPGVVTVDDGYADSALNNSHRFDQGALMVTVERMAIE